MSEDKKQKGFLKSISEMSFVKKLKSIKHIEIIIVVIFILILLLICFGGSGLSIFSKTTESSQNSQSTTLVSTTEYVKSVENKLENLLSSIKGAGNVQVMISIDSSVEMKFATDETITTSGQTVEKETKIVLVEVNGVDEPVIISQKLPSVNGVVVVCSGASDTKVKLDIIDAIQTLLNLESNKIQVFIGN